MPLTVVVRSGSSEPARLTFDGTQRIVLGRGSGCDVRLPDPSVSLRHASLRAQGADFVVMDEGSVNGTFVGGVRVASRTSRLVRPGDLIRLGRVWVELQVDHGPVTRDLALATRDLALALVAEAMDAMGTDRTTRLRVVEGRDQGAALDLTEEGRLYTVGRGAECDLPLADPDVSREHAHVVRRGPTVLVRDHGAKHGTWLGGMRLAPERDVVWKSSQVMQLARTVVALDEPVGDALALIEAAPDEALPPGELPSSLRPRSCRLPRPLRRPAPRRWRPSPRRTRRCAGARVPRGRPRTSSSSRPRWGSLRSASWACTGCCAADVRHVTRRSCPPGRRHRRSSGASSAALGSLPAFRADGARAGWYPAGVRTRVRPSRGTAASICSSSAALRGRSFRRFLRHRMTAASRSSGIGRSGRRARMGVGICR